MGSSQKSSSSSSSSNLGVPYAQSLYNQLYGNKLTPYNGGGLIGPTSSFPGPTTPFPGTGQNTDPATGMANKAAQDFYDNWTSAVNQNKGDYSGLMQGYQDWTKGLSNINIPGPMSFSAQTVTPSMINQPKDVTAMTPEELTQAYNTLRSATGGYQNFADTGGYSQQDISDLRARGVSPIRSTYANAQENIDRAKSLSGGYAPNYIAAQAKMSRDLGTSLSDATTNVNAGLASAIQQGKLAGLSGLLGTGSEMGGLSSQAAGRDLQAALANQGMNYNTQAANQNAGLQAQLANASNSLQAQGMSAAAANNYVMQQFQKAGMGLQGLQGQAGLYGTTPAMSSMFGNQALGAMGQALSAKGMSNDMMTKLISLMGGNQQQTQQNQSGPAWWTYALAAAPYLAMAFSDKNMKDDIEPIDEKKVKKGIKKLDLSTWKYKGDDTTHMGPMAQDVKKYLGIGDGKTLHLADIMGVMLATAKGA